MNESRRSNWPGYAGFFWALMYAVFVRFYQAAGGTAGLPGKFENPEGFFRASYIAGVFIMIAGFVLLALVKPWGKIAPMWMPLFGGKKIRPFVLLIPTLAGTAFALAHGFGGEITKFLAMADVITIHYPGWAELDDRRLALWDVLFYEPWFIIMGILAGLTAYHYARASGIPLSVRRRCTVLFLTLVSLLIALFVFLIILDF
ncbi:DUF3995 domain-containing protein [Paenibacillus humicola]|uniref:DUF3995 domain-containing protein n=1 Tax=Paenibacillus humicola TaxID=3110540 RepID=UPI00237A76C5|nr:DUF3995 domain-containing protein [Paenibacillus humicola]